MPPEAAQPVLLEPELAELAEHGDGRRPHLGDAVLEGSHEALEELGLEGVLAARQGHGRQRAVERRADPPVVVDRRFHQRGDARGHG